MLRSKAEFERSREQFEGGLEIAGREALAQVSTQARLHSPSDDFRATIWAARIGPIRLTRYEGDALVSRRTPELLNDPYSSLIQMGMPLRGEGRFEQGGRHGVFAAGSAVLLRQDEPFTIETSSGYASVQMYVDRRRLEAWGFTGAVASTWQLSPQGLIAADFIGRMVMIGNLSGSAESQHLAMALAHAGMAILADGRSEPGEATPDGEIPDAVAAVRIRALAAIDARFADPNLTADSLAQMLKVSRRFLYRAFEGADISVAGLLRDRRLDYAVDLLMDSHRPELAIATVAQRCGFSGASSFTRAFRARFGCAPSGYRDLVVSSKVRGDEPIRAEP